MLNREQKHEKNEYDKTQYEMSRSIGPQSHANKLVHQEHRLNAVGCINRRGRGVKALVLSTNLHSESRCNSYTKLHKTFASHNGSPTQSISYIVKNQKKKKNHYNDNTKKSTLG